MNKINYKIIIVLVFVLMLTLLAIVQTYALFETDSSGTVDYDIGQWVILLNGNDVKETRTLTLNQFTYTNGAHTENNYFAPGSSASFDIVINAEDSDVSVAYQIDIDDDFTSDYPNMSFSVKNLDTNIVSNSNSYSGLINLTDQSKIHRLRLTLNWANISQYDESDTSLIDGELEILVTANFQQYISE